MEGEKEKLILELGSPPPMASSSSSVLPISDPPRGGRDEKLFKGSGMTKRGAYAALSYMSCAVLLILFNKAALSSYSFPCANVITLFQQFRLYESSSNSKSFMKGKTIQVLALLSLLTVTFARFSLKHVFKLVMKKGPLKDYAKMICSCAFLYALRRGNLISFSASESLSVADNSTMFVPMQTLVRTLPVALTYLLYMLATMASVRGVNVPMYTTLRRTTVVFTMVVEYVLAGQKYTSSVIGSVALIVVGAFIAGARDLSFDFYGYAIVFVANITTAIYLATIARIGKSSGLNSFGLMWCNGIICGPILLFWTYLSGDFYLTWNFPSLFSPGFLVVMLLSCILAFFLNYSIFLNTTLNSALTQTICGNLKDLFTIGLGWILFGGLPFDFLNVVGQLLGFVGSGLYAYYKLMGM